MVGKQLHTNKYTGTTLHKGYIIEEIVIHSKIPIYELVAHC